MARTWKRWFVRTTAEPVFQLSYASAQVTLIAVDDGKHAVHQTGNSPNMDDKHDLLGLTADDPLCALPDGFDQQSANS